MSDTIQNPTETKKMTTPASQTNPSATANPSDALSKFVPQVPSEPAAQQAPAAAILPPTPPVVQPAPRAKSKPKVKVRLAKVSSKNDKQPTEPLNLGAGHVIPLRTNSAYWIFTKTLARMSGFEKFAQELDSVRSPSTIQAKEILAKMMVRKDIILKKISSCSDYEKYGKTKIKTYRDEAKHGDRKAKNVLTKSGRAKGNTWVGDLEEVINVAKGSYTTRNRNGDKYRRAGIVVRSFPLKAKRGAPLFLMMFPKRHAALVRQMIEVGMGVSERTPS